MANKLAGQTFADFTVLPAKFTAQSLLYELFNLLERRINQIIAEKPIDKSLNKSIRRAEDLVLSNSLKSLNGICEVCLPSVLSALIKWYEQQQKILPQIHFHPTECEGQVDFLITNAFKQISYRDHSVFGVNYNNSLIVAEAFSEVIGVLSQSHSKLVQRKFFELLNDLRKESSFGVGTIRQIISLLMGMKFFRIKTNQVMDFEMGVSFLDELGSYYLEVDLKQKDLKHAVAGLLVEILSPMAAQIKTEANVPALIFFVDKLYGPTYDLVNKKQHKMAAYPLLTCLLCISQSKFFLSTWVQFLNLTLANLKNKDPKISRIALESLYRLLWVYVIRNSCEGNTATRSRLESICASLFPRGNRNVIPRDAPLNIFVKIIHFIAQQKLDFAFKEIIFELLGCNRPSRSVQIYPERMNIGLRALMVIADGLQQKEPVPGMMPRTVAPLAAASAFVTAQRTKKSYVTSPLTNEVASSLGLDQYLLMCRKAFDGILRTLDTQVGRPLMITVAHLRGKDLADIVGADVRPKIDLLRTCTASIPRLLPDSMPHSDLIEFLTRMSVHIDEELRATAYLALQNIVSECADWREDAVHIYVRFLTNQLQDTFPALLEAGVRLLLQLLATWKTSVQAEQKRRELSGLPAAPGLNATNNHRSPLFSPPASSHLSLATTASLSSSSASVAPPSNFVGHRNAHTQSAVCIGSPPTGGQQQLHGKGLAQNMQAIIQGQPLLPSSSSSSAAVAMHCVEALGIVLLCQLRPSLKRLAIQLLKEARQLLQILVPDKQHDTPVLAVLDEATSYVLNKYIEHVPVTVRQAWLGTNNTDFALICEKISNDLEIDPQLVNSDRGNEYLRWDPWACAISGFCEQRFLPSQCPTAVSFAWPALFVRLSLCNQFIDPSNPQNETSRGSLLRSSKSKATSWTLCGETIGQESYLGLWQKYLVACCALCHQNPAPIPTSLASRSFSPSASSSAAASFSSYEFTELNRSMISSIRMTRSTFQNAALLFQKVVSMLKWDETDMMDSVALGVGSTNHECFDVLLDELNTKGLLREALERKNESNIRRRKRKDLLRLQLVRVLEIALFRGLLNQSSLLDRHSGQLVPVLLDLIDSIRFHVETDVDRDATILSSLRLHFARLITLMVSEVPLERRQYLFPVELRRSLFNLFHVWCSRAVCLTADHHVLRRRDGSADISPFVEQKAIQAICALGCAGPMFDCNNVVGLQQQQCSTMALSVTSMTGSGGEDEDASYRWLEALLASNNQTVAALCEETLCLMIHLNEHQPKLFELAIRMCYTKSDMISARCFRALAMLFAKREFPCEFMSVFVLCQIFAADSESATIRQTALLFLHLLRRQFLDHTFSSSNNSSPSSDAPKCQDQSALTKSFPMTQETICRQLAGKYTQLTMPVISEVCSRIESAKPNRQASMLSILFYWFENVELIDSNCGDIDAFKTESNDDTERISWGSEEGTQLLLTNLLYITAKLAPDHNDGVEALWRCLATRFAANLSVILNHFFIFVSLSIESMLPVARRVCGYLLKTNCANRLVRCLVGHLSCANFEEPFHAQLMRSEMAPFYRWQFNSSSNFGGKESFSRASSEPSNVTHVDQKRPHSSATSSPQELRKNARETRKMSGANKGTGERGRQIRQLPMPPYGGFYPRLLSLLPASTQSVPIYSTNGLALVLICDLIGADDCSTVNWDEYLSDILHMSVVFLDRLSICVESKLVAKNSLSNSAGDGDQPFQYRSRPLRLAVAEYSRPSMCIAAKQALINALLLKVPQGAESAHVSAVLLNNQLHTRTQQSHSNSSPLFPALYEHTPRHAFDQQHVIQTSVSVDGSQQQPLVHQTATDSVTATANHRRGHQHQHSTPILDHSSAGQQKHNDSASSVLFTFVDYEQILLSTTRTNGNSEKEANTDGRRPVTLHLQSNTELLVALVYCLSKRQDSLLWQYEEATPRCWKTESDERLSRLVAYLSQYFSLSLTTLSEKWTKRALDVALSPSSHQHIAVRSFQIAASLDQNPVSFVARLLSRLVDVACDGSEENQIYVTSLMMCIQSLSFNLEVGGRKSTTIPGHCRSISYNYGSENLIVQLRTETTPVTSPLTKKDSLQRHSLLVDSEPVSGLSNTPLLSRSKSATMLLFSTAKTTNNKNDFSCDDENPVQKAKKTAKAENQIALCQLMGTAMALLESPVDNEFLLATNLLDKLFDIAGSECRNSLDRLETIFRRLQWTSEFPGFVSLLSRGTLFTAHPFGYDMAIQVLNKCIIFLGHSVISGQNDESAANASAEDDAIATLVISSMAYFLAHFETPPMLAMELAGNILEYSSKRLASFKRETVDESLNECGEEKTAANTPEPDQIASTDQPLHCLAMMMDQYRNRTFPRDRFQWAKCVINYLLDSFDPNTMKLIILITEMLEKSCPSIHQFLLHIIGILVGHGDLRGHSPVPFNSYVVRVVSRHVQSPNSKEAQIILKTIIDRWSLIGTAQLSTENLSKPNFELFFCERPILPETTASETAFRRHFCAARVRDRLSALLLNSSADSGAQPPEPANAAPETTKTLVRKPSIPTSLLIGGGHLAAQQPSDTLAPSSSYSISNERLQRMIDKQQQQDDLDRLSSASLRTAAAIGRTTSGGELSSIRTTDSFPRVLKEFDFLEAEHDTISESNDSCFNWLSAIRSPSMRADADDGRGDEDMLDDAEDGLGEHDELPDQDPEDEDEFYGDDYDAPLTIVDPRNSSAHHRILPSSGGSSRRSVDDGESGTGATRCLQSSSGGVSPSSTLTPKIIDMASSPSGYVVNRRRKERRSLDVFNQNELQQLNRRPTSKASDFSDENEVSSERTPVQSKHSSDYEQRSPSPSLTDLDEEDTDEHTPHPIDFTACQRQPCNGGSVGQRGGGGFVAENKPLSPRNGIRQKTPQNAAPKSPGKSVQSPDGTTQNTTSPISPQQSNPALTSPANSFDYVAQSHHQQNFLQQNRTLFSNVVNGQLQNAYQLPGQHYPSSSDYIGMGGGGMGNDSFCQPHFRQQAMQHNGLQQPESIVHTPNLPQQMSIFTFGGTPGSRFVDSSRLRSDSLYSGVSNVGGQMNASSGMGWQSQQPPRLPSQPLPSSQSPAPLFLQLECPHHASGMVERVWMQAMMAVGQDADGELISLTMLVLGQLIRESSGRFSALVRDALHLFQSVSVETSAQPSTVSLSNEISACLAHSLNATVRLVDSCPFIFVSSHFIRASGLLQGLRLALYELREHFEALVERREQCIRAINSMKSALRLLQLQTQQCSLHLPTSMGSSLMGTPNGTTSASSPFTLMMTTSTVAQAATTLGLRNQELSLGRALQRLLFQLLLMLEKLGEMICCVQKSTNAQEYDLSPAVMSLHRELLGHLTTTGDISNDDLMPPQLRRTASNVSNAVTGEQSGSSPHGADSALVLQLTNRQFSPTFQRLRQLRLQQMQQQQSGMEVSGGEFGCCTQTDVDVLLMQFCKSHALLRTWALVGSFPLLVQSCGKLKETSMQLSMLVRSQHSGGSSGPTPFGEFSGSSSLASLHQQQSHIGGVGGTVSSVSGFSLASMTNSGDTQNR